ncbi:MAG: tetratricopeptide repeat protein [Anaerolineae bacterium]
MLQLDLLQLIPANLKQAVGDALVDFVSDQAKKFLSNEAAARIKKLRSNAAFNQAFEDSLKRAAGRFVAEYEAQDEDLVAAIAADKEFFNNQEIQAALLAVVRRPGAFESEDREVIAHSFATVLPQRRNRERVDQAVTYLLKCLAEELMSLPELQPIYSLLFQRLTAEAAREQVAIQKAQLQALTGLNTGLREALLQLTEAVAEQKLLPGGAALALPSPPKVFHNLPQPDYGRFVGREAEMAQVVRILRPYPHSQHALVTIDGIGGIGKSALALEVAHRYLRNFDRIPPEERFEAIIWASAKQTVLTAEGIATRPQALRTLDDIYTAIAVALHHEEITEARPEEQAEIVRRALTRQRTLLLVDNLETVDDEAVLAFLRELPAPTKAIVTTRHRLDVAYPVRLVGMIWEDAQKLIAHECAKKGVTLTAEEARRLYDRTGGVPLALAWSIAQMGLGYQVEAVLTRLSQPTSDIARFCFEGAVERIRGKPAHTLLLALSLFAKDGSREALGFVANTPELDRDEGLVALEKLSLVNKQGNRFWLLPLTKTFAAGAENPELWQRYVEYFANFCQEQIGPHYWAGSNYDNRLIGPELENLYLALEQAYAKSNWLAVQTIFVAIVHPLALSPVTLSKRIELAEKALVAAEKLGDQEMRAWLHIDALGYALSAVGDQEAALNHLRTGQLIAQEADLSDCLAAAETLLARWALERQDHPAAQQHFEKALAQAITPRTKIRAHRIRAYYYSQRREWDQANGALQLVVEMASAEDFHFDETQALLRLGENYLQMNELDLAEKAILRAQAVATEHNWVRQIAKAFLRLASLHQARHNIPLAQNYAEQARAIYEQLGRLDRVEEADSLLQQLNL